MNTTNSDRKTGQISSLKLVDGYQKHMVEVDVQPAKGHLTKY